MLVLTRKVHEKVVIGEGPDAVEVEVMRLDGDSVRLGFTAPRAVRVDRGEIRDRIDRGEVRRGGAR